MTKTTLLLLFAIALTGCANLHRHSSGNALFIPYDQAKWRKIIPELGPEGPDIAILHVDDHTGATQLLIRMNAAMIVPLHWHSAAETHTMIKGSAAFECDGKREILGEGGFNYLPARHHHRAWASANSLAFITVDGPWDVNWVEGPPTKEHLNATAVQAALAGQSK